MTMIGVPRASRIGDPDNLAFIRESPEESDGLGVDGDCWRDAFSLHRCSGNGSRISSSMAGVVASDSTFSERLQEMGKQRERRWGALLSWLVA
jgi:hypothetical protein